jgi:hypothetical protein
VTRKNLLQLAFLFVASSPGLAQAQTVYSNGGQNTLSGTSGPVVVQNNGTTLVVNSPASVTGSDAIQGGTAIVGQAGTTINLLGGTVTSATGYSFGPAAGGIASTGLFAAFGGYAQGADASATAQAGIGAIVYGTGDVFGGTFQGGNASLSNANFAGQPGFASFSVNHPSTSINISDGTFLGGNGSVPPGTSQVADAGAGAYLNSNFSVTGGTFRGGNLSGSLAGSGLFGFLGSDSVNGGRPTGQTGSITGGTFYGGTSAGSAPGYSAVVQVTYGSTLKISGGNFPDGVGFDAQENSRIDISGGLFGAHGFTLGAFVEKYSSLNVFGSDLSWSGSSVGTGGMQGFLSGTLADGDSINASVELASDANLVVSLTSGPLGEVLSFNGVPEPVSAVPEPRSVVLMAMGIASVAISCAYRRVRGRFIKCDLGVRNRPQLTSGSSHGSDVGFASRRKCAAPAEGDSARKR